MGVGNLGSPPSMIISVHDHICSCMNRVHHVQDQWTARAELAVRSGQDDLAREALKKRKAFEEQLGTWQIQLTQQETAVDQLLGNTRAMEAKMQEAKSKKETLKARAASAQSSKQVRCRPCQTW